MANTVRNLLGPPLKLRGPVTRADGGKTGVGRGYGGARIELENLTTTDPHSRQLLAAQLIWTLARADIKGPYVINADGAALDDRFADGWKTTDVAATDPGAADGASAGVHALMGGSMVALDGQRATKVPGSFGAMGDQSAAAFSRSCSALRVPSAETASPEGMSALRAFSPDGGSGSEPIADKTPSLATANTFTSPSPSCSEAVSRNLYFWILPLAVIGNSSTKNTYLGAL